MRSPHALLVALSAIAIPAAAQKMDPAAMQKWASAKVIYYTVEGIHSGETSVTPTMGGLADVVDRVAMNLEWSLADMQLLKVSGLTNAAAEVGKLRDREPKCLAPVLKGPLEMTVLEVTGGVGGAIDLKMEKSYPAVDVAQFCTASRKAVPASKKTEMISMMVPSPILMAMGAPSSKELSYSADGKSMIVKSGKWSWTFTPSVSKPR